MKKDITEVEDIKKLVDSFYEKVRKDETIGYIFTEVANVDWEMHLPKMYSFWETVLLGKQSFKGNPMMVHLQLSKKTQMELKHFEAWLSLWEETLNSLFKGEIAEEAKQRGKNIAGLMLYKIGEMNKAS